MQQKRKGPGYVRIGQEQRKKRKAWTQGTGHAKKKYDPDTSVEVKSVDCIHAVLCFPFGPPVSVSLSFSLGTVGSLRDLCHLEDQPSL